MKKILLAISLAILAVLPHRVVIETPDTTYHLTYCDFDGFLQTNSSEVYMRKAGEDYQIVIDGRQYDAVEVGADTLRIVELRFKD